MSEFSLIPELMNLLPVYGPLLLALTALGCSLGLPLPLPVLVLAAGALVRQGGADPLWLIAACLAGSLAGASLYYAAGCWAGPFVQGHIGRRLARAWQQAQARFAAQAGLAVYLTRFLLTPISIPIALIAGCRGYAYWRFALSVLAGDLMWVAGYGLAGYAVGPQWPALSASLTGPAVVAVAVIAAAVALYYAVTRWPALRQAAAR